MEKLEPDKTPPVEEDKYKSKFAEFYEEKSKEHREKIKELKEKSRKIIEELEKKKKTPDESSI